MDRKTMLWVGCSAAFLAFTAVLAVATYIDQLVVGSTAHGLEAAKRAAEILGKDVLTPAIQKDCTSATGRWPDADGINIGIGFYHLVLPAGDVRTVEAKLAEKWAPDSLAMKNRGPAPRGSPPQRPGWFIWPSGQNSVRIQCGWDAVGIDRDRGDLFLEAAAR